VSGMGWHHIKDLEEMDDLKISRLSCDSLGVDNLESYQSYQAHLTSCHSVSQSVHSVMSCTRGI